MWLDRGNQMPPTASEDWVMAQLGIVVIIAIIGCTSYWKRKSCWKFFQDKPPEPAARPEPPPPPTPGPAFRYERDLYPPNQPPGAEAPPSATQEPTTAELDADYEEDFEEIQDLHRAQRSDVKGHNSAQSTTRGAAQQGMYANLDVSRDYVNVPDVAVEGSERKEIPIYVKIIDSDPETNVAPGDEETTEKTPRSTINSIGKYSSHSDSLCHSYENVAMQSPPNVSELDLDYVNMTS